MVRRDTRLDRKIMKIVNGPDSLQLCASLLGGAPVVFEHGGGKLAGAIYSMAAEDGTHRGFCIRFADGLAIYEGYYHVDRRAGHVARV